MNEVDIENKETDETGAVVSGREILESDNETLRHSEGEGFSSRETARQPVSRRRGFRLQQTSQTSTATTDTEAFLTRGKQQQRREREHRFAKEGGLCLSLPYVSLTPAHRASLSV